MPTIRSFHPRDLEALYRISLATGFAGGDAAHLYADPKLMGHIYSASYALLEPELALVVEDRDGVAGFAVGTACTTAWEHKLEELWWPSLREQYAMPAEQDAELWSHDERRIVMIHRPRHSPRVIARDYPAHLHLNLLPRMQGRGIGARLLGEWLAIRGNLGGSATHVAVNRANVGALRFWEKMSFFDLPAEGPPDGRTIWKGRS